MTSMSGFEDLERFKRALSYYDLRAGRFGGRSGAVGLGGPPLLYDAQEGRLYLDASDAHTLVFGATGSRKTRAVVMPALFLLSRAGESVIINDAKGELYDRMAAKMQADGYEILMLNLRNPALGHGWNPLQAPYRLYANGEVDRACAFLNDIAENLSGEENAGQDPFWNNSAADLLFGLMLLLLRCAKEFDLPPGAVNISSVLALRQKLFAPSERARGIRDSALWAYAQGDELTANRLSGTVFAPETTRGSILSVFDSMMRIFSQQPTLLDMLAGSDFDVRDIARKKTALFLVVPDEKTSYHKLASLFIKQSYEMLIDQAMEAEDKRLARRVNYVLDEFSALPAVKDFPAMITAARSRAIRFLLVTQSEGALRRRYREEAETIKGNCANWIFFTSRELSLLRELSELCGLRRDQRTPNISPYELQHLSAERCEALALCGRSRPARVRLLDIDDPLFSGGSYDVLRAPAPPRRGRQALDFAFFGREEGARAAREARRREWASAPSAVQAAQDASYQALLREVDKRLSEREGKKPEEAAAGDLNDLLRELREEGET